MNKEMGIRHILNSKISSSLAQVGTDDYVYSRDLLHKIAPDTHYQMHKSAKSKDTSCVVLWKATNSDAGFILLMSLYTEYYLIITFLKQPPRFLMICVLFCPSLFIQHNNHWVRVIPKSIYSHGYPADVMHHSASNLTFLSNGFHCQLQNWLYLMDEY